MTLITPISDSLRNEYSCGKLNKFGGAVAQLGARLDGIEEVVGSNPIGSTKRLKSQTGLDFSKGDAGKSHRFFNTTPDALFKSYSVSQTQSGIRLTIK
jgi:hypothetical protein